MRSRHWIQRDFCWMRTIASDIMMNRALDTYEEMFWINGIEDWGIDDYFPSEQDLDGNGKGYIMSMDGKETYLDDAVYLDMIQRYIDRDKWIDVQWVDLFQMEDMVN